MSPWAPRKPCAEPLCPELVPPSGAPRCPRHAVIEAERVRGYDAARRGDPVRRFHVSGPWRTLRAAFLRDHPDCVVCGQPTEHVDHILPVRERPDLALDVDNVQALCWSCHSRKTRRGG